MNQNLTVPTDNSNNFFINFLQNFDNADSFLMEYSIGFLPDTETTPKHYEITTEHSTLIEIQNKTQTTSIVTFTVKSSGVKLELNLVFMLFAISFYNLK